MNPFNEKTTLNGLYLLEALVATRFKDVISHAQLLRKKYEIPERETVVAHEFPKKFKAIEEESFRRLKDFMDSHSPESISELFSETNKMRKVFGLGKEWRTTMTRFVITGVLIPARFNVYVRQDQKEKSITFEVNKNTTLEDLTLAWQWHIKDRVKIFGKGRAKFYSKEDVKKASRVKYAEAVKLLEKSSDINTMAKVNPEPDLESESTDLEEIGLADKRSANWLKQNRKRLRKVVTG